MKQNNLVIKEPDSKLLAGLINQQALQTEINKQIYLSMNSAKKEIKAYADKGIKELTTLVNRVEESVTLTYEEQQVFKTVVSKKAAILTNLYLEEKFNSNQYGGTNLHMKKLGQFRANVYRRIKRAFNVPRYSSLRRIDLNEAITLVNHLSLSSFEGYETRMTDTQLEAIENWKKNK
ncbi:ORF6C domain-containing protein [Liquorilactobacillus mali]|uniref:ORF6C domain-containing protein n=1 Tax=Liquorilactobacillus mali TaxID=1618 RepID=A0A0R2G2E6_9LACO|nr:ORF6C domain-containing protein [Liquorilactobacillus mali]KRN31133.1 hypothetical protein IV36_GL001942 [Liquorilactobacillus mali]